MVTMIMIVESRKMSFTFILMIVMILVIIRFMIIIMKKLVKILMIRIVIRIAVIKTKLNKVQHYKITMIISSRKIIM